MSTFDGGSSGDASSAASRQELIEALKEARPFVVRAIERGETETDAAVVLHHIDQALGAPEPKRKLV